MNSTGLVGSHAAFDGRSAATLLDEWLANEITGAFYLELYVDRAVLSALRGDATEVDLAAAEHGGRVVLCSDMFFGSRHHLILPGDARNMGDGWETSRRRDSGNDWVQVHLASQGVLNAAELDRSAVRAALHGPGRHPRAPEIDARRLRVEHVAEHPGRENMHAHAHGARGRRDGG